jgi:hypothetical protein
MEKQTFHLGRTISPFFRTIAVSIAFVLAPASTYTAHAQSLLTEEEAYAIRVTRTCIFTR